MSRRQLPGLIGLSSIPRDICSSIANFLGAQNTPRLYYLSGGILPSRRASSFACGPARFVTSTGLNDTCASTALHSKVHLVYILRTQFDAWQRHGVSENTFQICREGHQERSRQPFLEMVLGSSNTRHSPSLCKISHRVVRGQILSLECGMWILAVLPPVTTAGSTR